MQRYLCFALRCPDYWRTTAKVESCLHHFVRVDRSGAVGIWFQEVSGQLNGDVAGFRSEAP